MTVFVKLTDRVYAYLFFLAELDVCPLFLLLRLVKEKK